LIGISKRARRRGDGTKICGRGGDVAPSGNEYIRP
jgi:hypothetical protein